MALVNSDLLVVQKADSGDLRKVTVNALMSEASGDVNSVNGKIGIVVLDAADVGAATTAQGATADSALQPGEAATTAQGAKADSALQPGEAATPAQGTKADSALQPGDDVSELNNDAGYITIPATDGNFIISVVSGVVTYSLFEEQDVNGGTY